MRGAASPRASAVQAALQPAGRHEAFGAEVNRPASISQLSSQLFEASYLKQLFPKDFTCKIGFDTAENKPIQVRCMIRAREP